MGFKKDGSPHYTGKKGEIILAFTIKDLIAKRYNLTTQCRGIDNKGTYYELEDPDCRFLSLEKVENEFDWLGKYRKEVYVDVIRSVYQTDLRVSASSARERKDLRISLKWNSGSTPVQLGNLSFRKGILTSLQLQRFLDIVYRWRVLRGKWIKEEKTIYSLVSLQSKKWERYFIDLLLKDEKAQSDLIQTIKKRLNNEKDQLCIIVGKNNQIMYADYLYRFLFESIDNPKFLTIKKEGKSCLIQLRDPFILRLRASFPNTTEKSYSNQLYPKLQIEGPRIQTGQK